MSDLLLYYNLYIYTDIYEIFNKYSINLLKNYKSNIIHDIYICIYQMLMIHITNLE